MKRLLGLCWLLLASMNCLGQKLVVEGMETSTYDLTASTNRRLDLNGDPCALVKVCLACEGAEFEGNVLGDVAYKTGEYWVYMSAGSYMLRVKHPNFLPLMVNFHDYDIMRVEALQTYTLTLSLPATPNVQMPVADIETIHVNGVLFKMIKVQGGSFYMGATNEQSGDADIDEKPVHQVTLSDYQIGETEVTQALWEAVMGNNPSEQIGSNHPVEKVRWTECHEFIVKLNELTGRRFRLPTEAEWEYAARGGINSQGRCYSGSNQADAVAWYKGNSGNQHHEVKTKQPNELGIYDMSGNVSEWCEDTYEYYSAEPQDNPIKGPVTSTTKVCRGGSWLQGEKALRVSGRLNDARRVRKNCLGFRLVL